MNAELAKRANGNASRDEALRLLRSVYATARRQLALLRRATGLGSALVWALAEIASQPGLRVGDLADRMRVHPSTASNLCTRLRKEGLATTKTANDDRRAMCIFITAEGKVRLRRAPQPHRGVLAEALARMSVEECRRVAESLAPLRRELASVYGASDGLQPLE